MIADNLPEPENQVGGEGGFPFGQADSERRLEQRAIRERWPIPDKYREPVVNRIVKIVVDPTSTNREATSAARCLAAMDAQNVEATPTVAIQNNVNAGATPQQVAAELMSNEEFREFQRARLQAKVGRIPE